METTMETQTKEERIREFIHNVDSNNLDDVVEDAYEDLIAMEPPQWNNPEIMLENIIGYFEHYESYEKCAELQKVSDEIVDMIHYNNEQNELLYLDLDENDFVEKRGDEDNNGLNYLR